MLGGVKEDDLIVPLGDRLALRDEARGIVAAAFGGAGAARRGAGIILRHPERHRGRARLEIIADRRGDDEEMILGRRLHPQEHLARIHEGAQIERAALAQLDSASCRERAGPYVYVSVVAVSLKNTKHKT